MLNWWGIMKKLFSIYFSINTFIDAIKYSGLQIRITNSFKKSSFISNRVFLSFFSVCSIPGNGLLIHWGSDRISSYRTMLDTNLALNPWSISILWLSSSSWVQTLFVNHFWQSFGTSGCGFLGAVHTPPVKRNLTIFWSTILSSSMSLTAIKKLKRSLSLSNRLMHTDS